MLSNAVKAQRLLLGFHLPDPTWLNMWAKKIVLTREQNDNDYFK
jgi:hypothetical protein